MPQDRDGNAACTTPEKLLDQGMFASQARRDTSELLATSTSVGSPFPGTNRESKDGANTSIFGSPLVFRPRDQPATGSAPPDSGSRPNQDSAPVTPNTSNKAAAVRSKVSLPRPAHALPPTLPTNSGPTVTNIRAESLIGPTELQEAIISSAKELGSFPRSVPCVHSTNSIPKPSRMSDEPLMDLSPSTIGYLGELFVSRLRDKWI